MPKTTVDASTWSDVDAAADDGQGMLIMRLVTRVRELEAQVDTLQNQCDQQDTRLARINVVLHLW